MALIGGKNSISKSASAKKEISFSPSCKFLVLCVTDEGRTTETFLDFCIKFLNFWYQRLSNFSFFFELVF